MQVAVLRLSVHWKQLEGLLGWISGPVPQGGQIRGLVLEVEGCQMLRLCVWGPCWGHLGARACVPHLPVTPACLQTVCQNVHTTLGVSDLMTNRSTCSHLHVLAHTLFFRLHRTWGLLYTVTSLLQYHARRDGHRCRCTPLNGSSASTHPPVYPCGCSSRLPAGLSALPGKRGVAFLAALAAGGEALWLLSV